jgi:toxin ParE1/3/4
VRAGNAGRWLCGAVESRRGGDRYAHALDLPGLRFWPCTRYPYLVFYAERDEQIEVWRVLHTSRDIPRWLIERDPIDPG